MVRFVLCLIAGKEERIIRRCLVPAMPMVDAMIIGCNGKDKTAELARAAMDEHKMPGRVYESDWIHFKHNRLESYAETRKFAIDRGWPLDQTYAVLLDADQIIMPYDTWNIEKEKLTGIGYRIMRQEGWHRYCNLQLARLDVDWSLAHYTHEYWLIKGKPYWTPAVDNLFWIDDKSDGGSKSDKYIRDIRLCKLGIEECEPEYHDHYWFYLAISCQWHGHKLRWESKHLRKDLIKLRDEQKAKEESLKKISEVSAQEDSLKKIAEVSAQEEGLKKIGEMSAREDDLKKIAEVSAQEDSLKKISELSAQDNKDGSPAQDNKDDSKKLTDSNQEEKNENPKEQKAKNELREIITKLVISEQERLNKMEDAKKYYLEAKDHYQTCIKRKVWKGHLWSSHMNMARICRKLKDNDGAVKWFLEAYQVDNKRAEPFKYLSIMHRKMDKRNLAYMYAAIGAKMPYPGNDNFMVEWMAYQYSILVEVSNNGWYTGHHQEGFDASEELSLRPDIPESIQGIGRINRVFYCHKLEGKGNPGIVKLDYSTPAVHPWKFSEDKPKNVKCWTGMNPSILLNDKRNGYVIVYRTVNYEYINSRYTSLHNDGIIRTRNYLIHTDLNYNEKSRWEIVNNMPYVQHRKSVLGLEDCRLFRHGSRWWLTATTVDTRPNGYPQLTLCRLAQQVTKRINPDDLEGKIEQEIIEVDRFLPLACPNEWRAEKNWIPYSENSNIYVIYSHDPLLIYQVDPNTGKLTEHIKKESTLDFGIFRGSTFWIPFDAKMDDGEKETGVLILIHENAVHNRINYYTHRFMWYTRDWDLKFISKPFYFRNRGVEYCLSMYIDHFNAICFAVNFDDKNIEILRYNKDFIDDKLHDLPVYRNPVPQ